jgi:superfamily II DNA or RNA helicase
MPTATNHPELPLDHPAPLQLPAVELDLPIRGLGRIVATLQASETFTPREQVALPNRRTRTAFALRDARNRELLLTSTPSDRNHPDSGDIVLDHDGTLSWLRHSASISASDRLTSDQPMSLRNEIRASWSAAFLYRDATTAPNGKGLRPPQLGALHATLSHWTLSTEPVTVVMPTGTGKTETMLSLLVTAQPQCMLVVVPSKALRAQTANKFRTLGILPTDGLLGEGARRPIVGILEHQIKSENDLLIFDQCNVVVAVIDSIAKAQAAAFLDRIAARCSHLVLDEAHHVAAASWADLKKAFSEKPIVQFTATPFREDRSPLGGKQIYNYPLHRAQADGYFKPIHFQGIFEVAPAAADRSIATAAVAQLRQDLAAEKDHRLLARCRTKARAESVLAIYQELAADLNPVMVHSGESALPAKIAALREGTNKIVVTVNMLAEGFDMPQLKVAAIHDIFKSLAITLQFAGRFPRVGGPDLNLGDPTVITNTGFVEISNSLQSLYDEDPDWNELLARFSFERIEQENRFNEFLRNAQDLGQNFFSEDSIAARLTPQSLMPRYNAVTYRAPAFEPHGIKDGLEPGHKYVRGWQLDEPNMAFFVTRLIDQPRWTKSKGVTDSIWTLTALYFDAAKNLLYIGSSSSSPTNHQRLADSVTGNRAGRLQDEHPFRIFDGIQRLLLQQVGLLNTGSRNVRYSMFSGSDVEDAISRLLAGRSKKSNIFGSGFRDGGPVEFGCSRKGKIWGREFGSLRGWTEWCDELGPRLLNDGIDTEGIIGNVLVPRNQERLPAKQPWFIDWPAMLLTKPESNFGFIVNGTEVAFRQWDLLLLEYNQDENRVRFQVRHEHNAAYISNFELRLEPGVAPGHRIQRIDGAELFIKTGRTSETLENYFQEYLPPITFIDQSTLEGCQLVEAPDDFGNFPADSLQGFDWSGINIRKESFWKDDQLHRDSVQALALRQCQDDGFQLIFDDDGANEIADIVAIKDTGDRITIRLVHCKYSGADAPGARINDIVEVSSQAVKTCRWFHDIKRLARRMVQRDSDRTRAGQGRFITGTSPILQKCIRIAEISSHVDHEVIIVQPGLSAGAASPQILSVLGSADSYLRMAAGCPVQVWCSP